MHSAGRRAHATSLLEAPGSGDEANDMTLMLATFNVKNLLEPPAGPTAEASSALSVPARKDALAAKIAWIARMLRECDADVVGLQEIGPPELLAAVLAHLPGDAYREVIGTPDARGIRCALLSRAPILAARVHTAPALAFPVYREGDPQPFGSRIPLRRGVVHARIDSADLGAVDVLVVHFKSARPVALCDAAGREVEPTTARARAEAALRSVVWRAAEALHTRGIVDGLLAADPRALVAVVGDLNDVPDSLVVRTLCGGGEGALVDCSSRVRQEERFSSIHNGRRIQIDHVLATERLCSRVTAARFVNRDLREHAALPGGDEVPTFDSDHAPLVVRFG